MQVKEKLGQLAREVHENTETEVLLKENRIYLKKCIVKGLEIKYTGERFAKKNN